MKDYYVYILECSDKSLYIGITNNLQKRVDAHNGLGKAGAKYTKARRPVRLVFSERFSSRSEALKNEYKLKQLTRIEKLAFVTGDIS